MVFILEDLAKLEYDRGIISGSILEQFVYVQTSEFCEEIKGFRDNTGRNARHITRAIQKITEEYLDVIQYYTWGKMPGFLDVFQDTFLNAAMWGNKSTPGKKIEVEFKYGLYGGVILITDEGEGFDYMSKILDIKNGKSHECGHHGGGMRKFHNSRWAITYHDNGKRLSLVTEIMSNN